MFNAATLEDTLVQTYHLSSLQMLNVDYDYGLVSFDVHVDDLHQLTGLTSLSYLQMKLVHFSIVVDWFNNITKLSFITTISFVFSSLYNITITMSPLINFYVP